MAQCNETAVNVIDSHTFCIDQQYTEILQILQVFLLEVIHSLAYACMFVCKDTILLEKTCEIFPTIQLFPKPLVVCWVTGMLETIPESQAVGRETLAGTWMSSLSQCKIFVLCKYEKKKMRPSGSIHLHFFNTSS